jgi:glycosyltransferase involved in cell wall biosynthesis
MSEITVGFSTRIDKPNFIDYLKETSGCKITNVIQVVNNGGKSLSTVYNEILDQSTTDIVVLCHDDISFEKNYWGKRVLEHFEKNSEYGILGVAGTGYMSSNGCWWTVQSEMVGQVYHQHEGRKWLSKYSESFGDKIVDCVVVDGLFLAINKKSIKKKFDESVDGFHFYDINFCFSNFLQNVKIGTISNIPITHMSIGMTNQKWETNRQIFSEKYKEHLPIKLPSKYRLLKLNNKLPLVSVIIPIFDYGLQFEKTLQSVFSSNYENIEIIVVNDGSTDEYVLKKLESLKQIPNVTVIDVENGGPSKARNIGITSSKGDFILPLDADDQIDSTYIQSCVSILKNNKNVSPVYCDTNHIGEIRGPEKRPEWSMNRLLQGPFIVNCSMFHRKAFDEVGGYDEELKGWEDYDLWIRMAKKGYEGKRIPKFLFTYFHHEKDGTVSTEANINQQELYDKIMKKNFQNEIV